jgi:hypothetical protein
MWNLSYVRIHLAFHGIPIAPAIARNQGEYVLEFSALEGTRYGVFIAYI